MKLNLRLVLWLPLFCCVALLVGCGPDGRETVSVSGTVTLDGAPMADTAVMFTGPEGGSPVTATTDGAGNFTLDAVPGNNKVAVSKSETTGEVEMGAEEGGAMPDDAAMADVETKWIVPMKYANYRTSGLEVEVAKGMEPVKLDLVSK